LLRTEELRQWASDVQQRYENDFTALAGSIELGITATGSVQGDARGLTASVSQIATAAAGTGVVLPGQPQVAAPITVINSGANAVLLYPPLGGKINALAVNAAYSLPAGSIAIATYVSPTQLFVGKLT